MQTFYSSLNKIESLKEEKQLAVSVSGGVDSNTLLYLLKSWAQRNNKKLIVIYFDHNLRKESRKEFLIVKALSHKLELKCIYLKWNEKPISAILEKARIARYRAISEFCNDNNIRSLFTGHHADDIAETVAMRLLRQSNISGLCPLVREREIFGIKLLRPMLKLRKNQIYAYAKQEKIKFLEDPSNKNIKSLRSRIRHYLRTEKYLADNLIKSSYLFCKLKNITSKIIENQFHDYFKLHDSSYIDVDKIILLRFPKYMVIEFLKICFSRIGSRPYPPQSKALEKIFNLFNSKKLTNITISGCIVSTKRKKLLIMREFSDINKDKLEIAEKSYLDWDNRFYIKNFSNKNKIHVFPLGEIIKSKKIKKLLNNKKKSFNNLPYMVKICLPVIKDLEGSIFIPHLNIISNVDLVKNVSIKTKLLY